MLDGLAFIVVLAAVSGLLCAGLGKILSKYFRGPTG